MRISEELADSVGVATSTVRYYERIGLMPEPERSTSGYRDYDDIARARLLFVHRAKRMGLSLEQIGEILPIWDGVNCAATHEHVTALVDQKRDEINERIAELTRFAEQLDDVRRVLEETPPPTACLPDLSCCVPDTGAVVTQIAELPRRRLQTDQRRKG